MRRINVWSKYTVFLILFALLEITFGKSDNGKEVRLQSRSCATEREFKAGIVLGADEWFIIRLAEKMGWTQSMPMSSGIREDSTQLGKHFSTLVFTSCNDTTHLIIEFNPVKGEGKYKASRYCFTQAPIHTIGMSKFTILETCTANVYLHSLREEGTSACQYVLAAGLKLGQSEFQIAKLIDSLSWTDLGFIGTQVYYDTIPDSTGNIYQYKTVSDFRMYCSGISCSIKFIAEFCYCKPHNSSQKSIPGLIRYCFVQGDAKTVWESKLALLESTEAVDFRRDRSYCGSRLLMRKASQK